MSLNNWYGPACAWQANSKTSVLIKNSWLQNSMNSLILFMVWDTKMPMEANTYKGDQDKVPMAAPGRVNGRGNRWRDFHSFCTYLYKLILKDKIKKLKFIIYSYLRVCCKILLWQHKLHGHWKAVHKVRYKTLLLFKREEVLVCLSKIFTVLTSLSICPLNWQFHILSSDNHITDRKLGLSIQIQYLYHQKEWVTEEYLSSTCKCFQEWEEKELTCLVYFNSRTISYFVQQSYEAGFKICGEERNLIGLQLGHHFQTAHPIQVLQRRVGYFLHHTGFFTGPGWAHWLRNLKQLRSSD